MGTFLAKETNLNLFLLRYSSALAVLLNKYFEVIGDNDTRVTICGSYGYDMVSAVKKMQTNLGLDIDGKFGPKSFEAGIKFFNNYFQ